MLQDDSLSSDSPQVVQKNNNLVLLSPHIDIDTVRKNFMSAGPFPHVVIDNFFEPGFFKKLANELNEFYEENQKRGKSYNTQVEKNKWGSENLKIPISLETVGDFLRSSELLSFLEAVTGFKNLKVTDHGNSAGYSLLHVMRPNSYLGPHTDHTVDMGQNKNLYHVLNIITYVQDRWDPNWGGATTLYSKKAGLATDVEYRPNRALIFMHSPVSIHGTQMVSENARFGRMSLYFDYYSEEHNPYGHLNFVRFPLISSPHRFFLESKFDYLKPTNVKYLKFQLSHLKRVMKYYLFRKTR